MSPRLFRTSHNSSRTLKHVPKNVIVVLFVVLVALFAGLFNTYTRVHVSAASNNTINYQARILQASGAVVPDGAYNVEFKLYDSASAGSSAQGTCSLNSSSDDCWWVETRTGANKVVVKNGYISVALGSVTAFGASIPWDQQLWVTMNIGGTGSPTWDGEMSPRMQVTAVPYAYSAAKIQTTSGANTSTLSIVAPTGGNQVFQLQDQGAAGTYNICIQNSSSCGFVTGTSANFIQNQNAAQQAASNFWISGTGRADTAYNAPVFDTATSAALSVGTVNASSVTVGKAGANTTVGGALIVSQATTLNGSLSVTGSNTLTVGTGATTLGGTLTVAGTTTLNGSQLTNNGSTLFGTLSMSDRSSNGDIDTAANTVNIYSAIAITQTSIGKVLSLPNPTSATAGRVVFVSNIGTQTFTMHGFTVDPGGNGSFVWNGTTWAIIGNNGGSGNYIQNQNAVQQSASNFWISGTGRVDGGIITTTLGSIDQSTASTSSQNVTIKSGNALGASSNSGNVNIDAGTATGTVGTVNIGATNANTVNISKTGGTTAVAGALTVGQGSTFNGNITQSGSGSFSTGTGAVALNGNTAVTGTLSASALGTFNGGLTIATGSTFTNGSSTLNTAVAITDKPTGGSIGTAPTTVDVATSFTVNQTTTGQTLTIPSPTVTTAGRIIYISNIGSASFIIGGNIIGTGNNVAYVWNGTAWAPTGVTGVTTVGAIDSQTKSANGAVISGSNIYLQTADATNVGLVSTTTQTFAGAKTFSSLLTASGITVAANSVFTNNGATLNTVLAVANDSDGGSLGGTPSSPLTAAQSVDIYTAVTINQTTAGQTITLPSPTNTAAGRILYISNIGTQTITMYGFTIAPSGTAEFVWNGTSWTLNGNVGGSGNFIQNQSSVQQPTSSFWISGAGRSDTGFTAPSLDVATAGTLSIGTSTATAITLGKSGITTTNAGSFTVSEATNLNGNVTLGDASTDRITFTGQILGGSPLVFQGATDNSFTTTINVSDPTANRTITIPNNSGTFAIATSGSATGGTSAFVQDGSTWGANANLGTKDAFSLNLLTNNTTRLTIDSSGNVSQSGAGTFGTGTGAVSLNGNTSVTGSNTLTVGTGLTSLGGGLTVSAGTTTLSGGLTVGGAGSVAIAKGTDFSTTGASAAASFTGSLIRLTGASTQTIQGITGAADGRIITLVNAAAQAAVIANQSGSAAATERIVTGTGADISLAPDASLELRYDNTTQRWRVIGGIGGTGVTTVGAISGTSNANGATITGNTINLTVADATNGGVVSNGAQTFAGAKTFAALLTGQAGATVSGAAISLNDSSNFNTTINTGTSTGTVTIGNGAAGAIALQSGTSITLTGATNVNGTTNINNNANNATNINTGTSTGAVTIGNASNAANTVTVVAGATNGINLNAPKIESNAATLGLFTTPTTVNAFTAASAINLGAASTILSLGNGGAATVQTSGGNGNLSVTANGTGILALNTSGAGTVNLGTANTTTIGIGNTSAAVSIQGSNAAGAVSIQAAAGGTISIGSTANNNLNLNTGAVAGTTTIGGTGTTGTITLGQSTATNTISVGAAAGNGATQTINIGTSATAGSTTSVTVGSTIAGAVTLQSASTVNLNAPTVASNATTLNLFNTPTTITGLQAATSISLGATTGTLTVRNANTTLGNAAGSGLFQNNGATRNATLALGDLAAGSLGTAAATVDVYTSISIAPTAAGRTYTIPSPTSTTIGRVLYISNIHATNSFIIGGTTFNAGSTATMFWNGTAWAFAGMDGGSNNYIQNQTAADQSASFRISGTGFVNTTNANAFRVQSASGADTMFNIDTTTGNAVKIGNNTGTGAATTILVLDSATTSTGLPTTVGAMYYDTTAGRIQCYEGTAWGNCGNTTLQEAYTSSTGGTTPEVLVDTTRNGLDIQDANTTLGNTVALLAVRASATATTLGGSLFQVNNNAGVPLVGIGLGTQTTSTGIDLQFGGSANRTIQVLQNTATGAGRGLTVKAGQGNAGAGGILTLAGGDGQGTNQNGGNVVITGGVGTGTGVKGLVVIDTATFSTASLQTSGVSVDITQANVDSYGAVLLSASASGITYTLQDPTLGAAAAGRIIYVTNSGTVNDFTLSFNGGGTGNTIAMKTNTTATMIWNGTDWTAAGASSSTDLQAAYNNTLSSAGGAEIVLNNTASANGFTIRNNGTNPISGGILEVQSSIGTNLFSVNNLGTELAANGGAETVSGFGTNWSAAPAGGTITQTSTAGQFVTGVYGVQAATTTTNHGVRNNLSANPAASTTYQVSFTIKTSVAIAANNLDVQYSPDGGTTLIPCSAYSGRSTSTTVWTKVTCTITTTAAVVSNPDLIIRQLDATARNIWIDNLSFMRNDTTTQPSNVQIGGGNNGGPITLFTLDRSSAPPVAAGDSTFYGSMYYDTTTGSIQCYEADGWGACGSPPANIITLTPEYPGAVLGDPGTVSGVTTPIGVGTMTAEFCSNQSGTIVVGTLCSTGEARNFYRWTSPQATDQTYSVYVTYKLPTTFKEFNDANTIKLTAYTTSTSLASASLQVFRKNVGGGTISSCGSATTINSSATTWQQTAFGGDETACGFVGGDYVIFKINVTAKSNASVYIENLDFTYNNR